jgi:hypothetical protein
MLVECASCQVTLVPNKEFFEFQNGEYNKNLLIRPTFNIFIFIIIYKPNNFGFAMF